LKIALVTAGELRFFFVRTFARRKINGQQNNIRHRNANSRRAREIPAWPNRMIRIEDTAFQID